jgi:photosystem II stability/assembly factor-like uncharacterized protein
VCKRQPDPDACGPSCTPCSAPQNGAPVCLNGSCDFTCNTGYHRCGDKCLSDTSAQSCGARCEPCPAPRGGGSICQNGACVPTCPSGWNLCGDACVQGDDPDACGPGCVDCPAGTGEIASCTGGTCGKSCASGYHDCSGTCLPNDNSASCGSRCSPCPDPPNATGLCEQGACTFTCNAGFNLCGGQCVGDGADHCGASCTICPAPLHGAAGCANGKCTAQCDAGYFFCNGACIGDDASTCGTSCAACAAPANAAPSCKNGQCGFACLNGFHLCNGACVSDASPQSCGQSCTPCAAGPNEVATCDGTSCGTACKPATHLCDGACVSDASPLSCGSSCVPCPTPENAQPICVGGICGFDCTDGFLTTATGCDPCTSPTACGLECAVCPIGPNATGAECDGNDGPAAQKCRRLCKPGFHLDAAGNCVACTTAAACGTDCLPCASDPYGTSTCAGNTQPSATSCILACLEGFQLKNGRCVTRGWHKFCLPNACNEDCLAGCGGGGGGGGGNNPCWGDIESVAFADAQHGVIAGSQTLFSTQDGGATWSTHGVGVCGLEASYPSPGTAYVTARAGGLFKTTDGGATWATLPVGADVRKVHFSDAAHGFLGGASLAAAGGPAVYRTGDGGGSFSLLSTPLTVPPGSVYARDTARGWLAGSIHRTTDAGATWSTSCVGCPARTVVFATAARGWFHDKCSVYTSLDGGVVWVKQQDIICSHGNLTTLDAVSVLDAWVGGAVGTAADDDGIMFHTRDGGLVWYAQDIPASWSLNDVSGVDAERAYAVGEQWGAFWTDSGGD